MSDDHPPLTIYNELVDKARRANTATPGEHWPELELPVDRADATFTARVFELPDGSRYERVPPNDIEAA